MIKAMANYREEFQKLLESLYIPTFGDVKKIEKDINAFLGNVFQHVPEKLYRYRICNQNNIDQFARERYVFAMQIASRINMIHVFMLIGIE